MTPRLTQISKFRFNLPQRIAAALLALFLAQGLWIAVHQGLTGCGLLLSLSLLAAGLLLGGGLWWVTRRLYGNLGGYLALTLYCFSPLVLKACTALNPEVLTALGIYGGVYTCIGVAHAMQGPRRKWRPRIVLLTAAFALVALTNLAALPVVALLGLAFMLWVAEGRRTQVLPVVLVAVAAALAVFCLTGVLLRLNFSGFYRSGAEFLWLSPAPKRLFFGAGSNAGITLAFAVALLCYLFWRRSRYFGNTAPLLCALALLLLATIEPALEYFESVPHLFAFFLAKRWDAAPLFEGSITIGAPSLWALPFLLTFVGGVFADACEGAHRRMAVAVGGAIVLLQAVLCVLR